MATRQPNDRLAELYRETGWSMRQFARAVNRIGTERGTPTKYQQPSVHQWLGGQTPKETTRPLIIEALIRKLERPISHDQAGFPARIDESGNLSIMEGLINLGRLDMDPSRRSLLSASLFSVAATVPNWQEIVGRMEVAEVRELSGIGQGEIEMVVAMTKKFSDLDYQFGGRGVRPLAAAFLVNTVAPYLSAPGPQAVRKNMFSAASDLCYLAGYMAIDEGLQGLGQQYYIKAIELAGVAEDRAAYSLALHGMGSQAIQLGHKKNAVRLTSAAMEGGPHLGSNMRAFNAGQRAYAIALNGDRRGATASLSEAEREMNKTDSVDRVVMGQYREAVMEFDIAQVKYALGDLRGSVDSLERYHRLRNGSHRRRAVLDGSTLAERQLEGGQLEAACATWHKVLDDYGFVQSERADRRIAFMKDSLTPHLKNHFASALYERTREVLQYRSVSLKK
ncbi:tetratricopeptide repeat protein [Streptomyces sp. NPDC127068]|uniref:tetratricopeptide repeat protein n=1 Tax=Streptomyces sp. NPDC127068 TaxID=3347127 RepID=UPI00364AA9FB